MTLAVRMLLEQKVEFKPCLYDYQEKGGTAASSRELGVPEHAVIKTLIFEDEKKKPFIVLMHGDLQVSAKQLARLLNVKSVSPCDAQVADRHSGYTVGGTSPFGTKKAMPVYAEKSIFDLEKIYINGGKRGFLIEIKPSEIERLLNVTKVEVAIA